MKDHEKKQPGRAYFTVDSYDKQRSAGKLFDPFAIQYENVDNERTEWEVTSPKADKLIDIMWDMVNTDKTDKQLAKEYNMTVQGLGYYKSKAKEKGYLNDKGKVTQAGFNLFGESDTEGKEKEWDIG